MINQVVRDCNLCLKIRRRLIDCPVCDTFLCRRVIGQIYIQVIDQVANAYFDITAILENGCGIAHVGAGSAVVFRNIARAGSCNRN